MYHLTSSTCDVTETTSILDKVHQVSSYKRGYFCFYKTKLKREGAPFRCWTCTTFAQQLLLLRRNILQKINKTHNLIVFATTRQNSKISDWVACDYHAENYFISHAYKVHDGGKKVTFSGTGDHSPIYSAYAAARSQRRHKNLVKLQIPGSRLYVMWEIRIVDIKNPAAHNSHFRQVIELLMRLTYHFSYHKIFILSSHIKSQKCCCCDAL